MTAQPNAAADTGALDVLMRVPLHLSAELGRRRMTLAEILAVGKGSIVELDRAIDAPVDVYVEGTLIARGEIVAAGDSFAVRVTELAGRTRPAQAE